MVPVFLFIDKLMIHFRLILANSITIIHNCRNKFDKINSQFILKILVNLCNSLLNYANHCFIKTTWFF